MLREIILRYGKGSINVKVPERNFVGLAEPRDRPGVLNPMLEVSRAIDDPVKSSKLDEIVKAGDRVVIVVDDATRPTPSYVMVNPLLRRLEGLGVKDRDVVIIFACGSHRFVRLNEMEGLIGREALSRFKVINHDCKAGGHVYLGRTSFGTIVKLNKAFMDADVRILTGDVEYHYYAGYGGGRKSVLPGVSAYETIQQNHSMLTHPKARTGVLEGNPIHLDMVEAAEMADVDFIVNIVMNGRGDVVKAFAGDLKEAFLKGVELVDEMFKVKVPRKADIIVLSAGGYPADIDLYQAYKAIDNVLNVVKDGGVIIALAECIEGHGHSLFKEWMGRYGTSIEMGEALRKEFLLGAHKAYYLQRALERLHIIMLSSMDKEELRNVFKLSYAEDFDEALKEALNIAGKDASILIVPNGAITLLST